VNFEVQVLESYICVHRSLPSTGATKICPRGLDCSLVDDDPTSPGLLKSVGRDLTRRFVLVIVGVLPYVGERWDCGSGSLPDGGEKGLQVG